jgi:hypothetical protein
MSELDDALAHLEEALARLEAASSRRRPAAAADGRVEAVAAEIAGRVDRALAKLGRLLEREV